MAEIPNIVRNKLEHFLSLLKKNNIMVQKAILFGSYANGKYDKWSDIDIAIVSDDFTGDSFKDKLSLIDLMIKAGTDISPLPFRSEDFEDSLFARDEIIKNGISII
jgi:predicted nucleotidyltransferase